MNSTKKSDPFIKQIFILSISGLIGIIIVSFSIWLFYSMRGETEDNVKRNIKESLFFVQELSKLKMKELAALTGSINNSPLFKGAMASQDLLTIEDVLGDLVESNELSFVAIIENKVIKYSSGGDEFRGAKITGITTHHFIGVRSISDSELMIIGREIDKEVLSSWEKLLNVNIVVTDSNFNPIINTLPINIKKMQSLQGLKEMEVADRTFYTDYIKMFKEKTIFHILFDKDFFWKAFNKKRNSLVFTGVLLFFLGLMSSIVIAFLVEPLIKKKAGLAREEDIDIRSLIDEIEQVKASSV